MNYEIWKGKFEEIYKTYEVIDSYLQNKDAIHLHLKTLNFEERIRINDPEDDYLITQKALPFIMTIASLLESDQNDKPFTKSIKKIDEIYHQKKQNEPFKLINEFSSQFAKQIIVMMYSHLYDCLKDYFRNILKKKPEILSSLINAGTEKEGYIKFKIVLDADRKETIVEEQINISSSQLVDGGKFKDVFKRIEKYSEIKIEKNAQNVIIAGHDLRNKIVHEITNTELVVEPSPKEIKESIIEMLNQLEGNADDSRSAVSE